ncbi:MAG: hypothetical protein ACREER_10070 [Alphaproteobacteria bacterium]
MAGGARHPRKRRKRTVKPRNPIAKAVRAIAPKVKPGKRRRTRPEPAEWPEWNDGDGG